MKVSHIAILLVLVCFVVACTKQTVQPSPTNLGWDFQPLDKGHFVIYEVDSIIYDDFDKTIDTFQYEMMDEIGDEFQDDQGRVSNYVLRYQRKNSSEPWVVLHVFYITQDEFKLEWQENNLRFIKMVYPVQLNKKWKGNAFLPTQNNTDIQWMNDWDYQYTDVLTNYNTGLRNYKNCHIIEQADFTEGLPDNPNAYSAHTFSQEVFSKNIGMVYREITRWEYQTNKGFRNGFTTIFRAKSNN